MDSKNQTQKRQIKFRAWDKKRKRFGYFLLSQFGIDIPVESYLPLNLHRSDDDEIYRIEYEDIEWLQYTGLHDKNGKEIYEGDIVRCSDGRIAKIIWFEFGWYIESKPFSKMEKSYAKMDNDEGYSVILMEARRYGHLLNTEVIGNIYENPELL